MRRGSDMRAGRGVWTEASPDPAAVEHGVARAMRAMPAARMAIG
jgi:hypothetical protein